MPSPLSRPHGPRIGAGGAAMLVDAYDPAAITTVLERLAADDTLCTDLTASGLGRVPAFPMARHQQRVGALYGRILS